MAINENDKYYTPKYLVEKTIKKTRELIPLNNISEIIEPSAGDGAFLPYLQKLNKPFVCYDILPENKNIIKQDFLQLDIPYKKGRVIIGNPPYGSSGSLFKKFLKKSSQIADYIVFILPVSQFENTASFKDGQLIYTENLGAVEYYGKKNVKVKTCLNIYKVGECIVKTHDKILKEEMKIRVVYKRKGKFQDSHYDFDFYIANKGSALTIHKQPESWSYFGIKILKKENRKKIARLLFSLKDIYLDDVISRSTSFPSFNKTYLQKIIETEILKVNSLMENNDETKLSAIVLFNLCAILTLSKNKKLNNNYRFQIYGSKLSLDTTFSLESILATSLFIINEIPENRAEAKFSLNYASSGFI